MTARLTDQELASMRARAEGWRDRSTLPLSAHEIPLLLLAEIERLHGLRDSVRQCDLCPECRRDAENA